MAGWVEAIEDDGDVGEEFANNVECAWMSVLVVLL